MILATKRLTLREMSLNDVDDLLDVFVDPEAMQFYPMIDRWLRSRSSETSIDMLT